MPRPSRMAALGVPPQPEPVLLVRSLNQVIRLWRWLSRLRPAPASPVSGDVKVVRVPQFWTPERGWHENPDVANRRRVLSLVGGSDRLREMVGTDSEEQAFAEVVSEAQRVRSISDDGLRKAAVAAWLAGPVRNYLGSVVRDQKVVDAIGTAAASEVIDQIE